MMRPLKLAISLLYMALSAPMILAQSDKDKDQAPVKHRIMSWTADRREYAVGDVITVLVSEATLATATKSQTGTDQQTRQNNMGIHPPTIGTTTLPSLDAEHVDEQELGVETERRCQARRELSRRHQRTSDCRGQVGTAPDQGHQAGRRRQE